MRDLLVIVPTRDRPRQLYRLLEACHLTCQEATDVAVCLDNDDPQLDEYLTLLNKFRSHNVGLYWVVGPRHTLTGWTNEAAHAWAGKHFALASLGDDHVPRTEGWDRELTGEIRANGGTGIAYGNDLLQGEGLPTAPVISADIVQALGWFCEPNMQHYYVDNVWKVLAEQAGCLYYRPDVVVEHMHPGAGKAQHDQTYQDALSARWNFDAEEFNVWHASRREADVTTVRKLRVPR